MFDSTENCSFPGLMMLDEFTHLVDRLNTVQVALALCHSQCKQAMTAENKALRSIGVFDGPFHQKREFESGTLPRYPRDLASKLFVKFFQLPFTIRARRQSNSPVRMQMIYVREGKECMNWGINRRGNKILAKGRQRIVANHLIFILFATVLISEFLETIQVE